jgi:hypothetical protein
MEEIAGNPSINRLINECFSLIGCEDARRHYLKRFRNEKGDERQLMSTFRELLIGGYFARSGYRTRRCNISGQTPDWQIERGNSQALVEVFTKYIDNDRFEGGPSGRWVHEAESDSKFIARMRNKIEKYSALAHQNNQSLVIAGVLDLELCLDIEQACETAARVVQEAVAGDVVAGCLLYENLNQHQDFRWVANSSSMFIGPPSERIPSHLGLLRDRPRPT